MNFLDAIVADVRLRVEQEKKLQTPSEVQAIIQDLPKTRPFYVALAARRPAIIAEFKRKSPSKGELNGVSTPAETARLYEAGGASAMSVLMEQDHFAARPMDLIEAKEACNLPILRKDFLVDLYQVDQSRLMGADAILLIVRLLGKQLGDYLRRADDLGLGTLVEVHDEQEMQMAVSAGAGVIGINNRDLATFAVSLTTTKRLAKLAPKTTLLVSESGIRSAADVDEVMTYGAHAVLVGEHLMRNANPELALRSLRHAD